MDLDYVLVYVSLGREIAQFHLPPGETLVGRAHECEIRVTHHSISRRHALIEVAADVRITDLQSRNGTYVNDEPVTSTVIEPGEVVKFGSACFKLLARRRFADEHGEELSTYKAPIDGGRMSLDEALHLVSPAQQRVFELLIRGLSERETAEQLHLSIHTVHTHIREIYRILNVHSRAELLSKFVGEI